MRRVEMVVERISERGWVRTVEEVEEWREVSSGRDKS